MELPREHIPASVTVMNVRPGCSNVHPLRVIVSCPRVQPSAQLSACLFQRAYLPWVLHLAERRFAVASGWGSRLPLFAETLLRGVLLPGIGVCVVVAAWLCKPPRPAPPEPVRDDVLIHVHLVDHIDYQPGAEAFGLPRCANGVCVLHVLRERYPFCLLHALRHAFEGDWHPGRETLDDC